MPAKRESTIIHLTDDVERSIYNEGPYPVVLVFPGSDIDAKPIELPVGQSLVYAMPQADPIAFARMTEVREGIGACDCCDEARYPQEDLGYGVMLCVDCMQFYKVRGEWK